MLDRRVFVGLAGDVGSAGIVADAPIGSAGIAADAPIASAGIVADRRVASAFIVADAPRMIAPATARNDSAPGRPNLGLGALLIAALALL